MQLFADPDKTEKPTPRRRQKAREEGNVAASQELNMALSFLFISVALAFIGAHLSTLIQNAFIPFLSLDMHDDVSIRSISERITQNFSQVILILAVLVFGSMGLGVLTGAIQTKFLVAPKAVKFDFGRINPAQGFKRLFSLRSVFEVIKAMLKVVVVGLVGYFAIKGKLKELLLYPMMSPIESSAHLSKFIISVMIKTGIALLALSVFDYFYQRWEYERNLMMTKQEVKEEMKDIEGNPEVKRRQRQMMIEILRSRMMQEVPKATVVITNPDHVAVALKYEREEDEAPMVVAKGKNQIAEAIKKVAREYNIPIVRNPPLAWELYDNVEIGELIPPDLYRAVAEVLVYVYSLKEGVS